jgi:DNA transposition AAA+ family ATPase
MIASELQAAEAMDDAPPSAGAASPGAGAAPVAGANDLRAFVAAQMELHGWSQKAAAKKIGIGESVLSLWMRRSYDGNNAKIEAAVARWRANVAEGEAVAALAPSAPVWVPTPTSKRIIAGLRFAQTFASIACIDGGAGVGKTRAITFYKKNGTNVWVATATPTEGGLAPALRMVHAAVGLDRSAQNLGASELMAEICKRLENSGGLLVIDEAQHLSVKALDQMRSIHDRVGVGLALAGNKQIYANLTGGRREAHFAQLFSRIGMRVKLTVPTVGDVEAIAKGFGVERRDEIEFLKALASRPGALRAVVNALRSASLMAAEDEKTLSLEHLQAAWADLGAEA